MTTCQYCGAKNPVGASFCDGCGAALTGAVAAHAQATAQAQVAAAHAARAQATAKQGAVHANPHFGTGRLPPQTMLGKRYLVLKTIGRGGMAAVYQATDTKGNRVVAIKEMSQEDLSPDEVREALDSFKREAALLQKLQHPNLPRVYADFTENGRNYLVMDFIDGETLEQKLVAANGPLPEAATLGWARQLCDVLSYLHTRTPPIIFRDLKPANVMVTKKGEVKLIDFGIARLFARGNTHDTQALGTPGYAPPEQYGNSQTDARSDIYALGATLYHLLTNYDVGRTPFALPPLRTRNPKISERTAAAIERATRLDRKDRYQDVRDFARDLGLSGKGGAQSARATQGQARPTAGPGAANRAANPPGGAGAKGPTGQPGQRSVVEKVARVAATAATAAAAAAIKSQKSPQASAKTTAAAAFDAAIAAALTGVGPSVALVAQPRQVDLGRLVAGQDGSTTLTVGGQNSMPVSGTLRSLERWLYLDKTQFNGATSLIQVTARTSQISGVGRQRGTIEVKAGNQTMLIPVDLEVLPAPGAAPKPRAQASPQANVPWHSPGQAPYAPGATAGATATASAAAVGARGPARRPVVHTAAVRRPNPFATLLRQSNSMDGLRLVISVALALLLAFGLPALITAFATPQLSALLASSVWQAWALLAVGVVGALIGAPLAYIGSAPSPGRLRTGTLLAGAGALLALSFTAQWSLTPAWTNLLPGATQVGALALTLPLLVSVGAAFGAQPAVSRAILAVARYIAARYRLVLLVAAIAGGWFGLTGAQFALSAIFQQAPLALSLASGCGLIVGVALGLLLATPIGYLVRRFAFG